MGFGEDVLKESYTDDIKIMMESVLKYPITVAQSANATGKTHGAARVAAWFYKAFAPYAQVYTAAAPPEKNLRDLLWGEIGSLAHNHPEVFSSDRVLGLHIARSPQSFLTGVTIPSSGTEAQREAKFSGKHAAFILFIIDEADAVFMEVFRGIESCMSGGFARLLCMFNPRSESGPVYQMVRDKRANVVELSAFNHPNVRTGEDRIPGAVNRETTVRRINEWTRRFPKGEKPGDVNTGIFQLPEFLEGSTASRKNGDSYPPLEPGWYQVVEAPFSYMVLGEYPAQAENQLISKEWTARARARWDLYVSKNGAVSPKGAQGIMGLDAAEFGADPNALCFRYGCWVPPITEWNGVDTVVTAQKGIEYYRITPGVKRAFVCAIGVGAGIAPYMVQHGGCIATSIKVSTSSGEECEFGEFYQTRDELWWACREWLRTDLAMLPPDEELLEELHVATYAIDPRTGKIKIMNKDNMKERLGRSPNRADALNLTFAKITRYFEEFLG